ncbi:MAG: hypothetical protein JST01_16105 [Cyanobacteria bacterium SZAS TMP-1]|nr:hypothetical protein [Cyanobacteria bacterium SZAS TMP-1]
MHLKSLYRLALIVALTAQTMPMFQAPATGETAAVGTATKQAEPQLQQTNEPKAYFLHIDGRALPLKQALVNGVNVLGGAVISLSLPVNISGYTRAGLNTLQLDYISDPKADLSVTVEKRTPGPKREEIARINIAADDSKGAIKSASVSFNLPADGGSASVGELSDEDKAAITREFDRYYQALAAAKADQLRAMYRQSLADQRKLSPESAHFFENVIAREAAILKNKELKLTPINKEGLAYKVEGDIVKLYRQDNKPLIESNEIDAQIAPLMVEVSANKGGKRVKPKGKTTAARPGATKDIEIPASAFQPDGHKLPGAPLEVKDEHGNVMANEISITDHGKVFDGAVPSAATEDNSLPPVKTEVRERLVRFNLYFKPARTGQSGKRVWIISLPPNV